MATDQEFSFPTINDSSYPFSIDSPPLWNLSPAASPNPYGGSFVRESSEEKAGKRMKSLSCIEINGIRRIHDDDDDDDDDDDEKEKMDLLWEDFNEELMSSRTTTTTTTTNTTSTTTTNASSSRDEEVEESRTVAKRRSNNNAALILPSKNSGNSNNNRPGMVVLVKVLKKLFSLSNSQPKPRNRVAP